MLLFLVERLWTEPFFKRKLLKKDNLLHLKHLNKKIDALSLKQSFSFRIFKDWKNSEVWWLYGKKQIALIAFFCSTKILFVKFLNAENHTSKS